MVQSSSVKLTVTSLYILREVESRIKYRLWKFPDDRSNLNMIRSSLNFIIPLLDTSILLSEEERRMRHYMNEDIGKINNPLTKRDSFCLLFVLFT